MNINYVPVQFVVHAWGQAAKLLEPVIKHVHGEFTLEQARVYVNEGMWTLLVAVDDEEIRGAALIRFYNRANERVAHIMAIGGRLITNQDTFDQLRKICLLNGANTIEGAARESVARLWRKYGFSEKYRIVGVKI